MGVDARTSLPAVIGRWDLLWLVLDTLRYDVAADLHARGLTPNLAALIGGPWEERHAPASFTYAAHQAFFAGFLPTPVAPGRHARRFALAFPGSETTGPDTVVLDAPDVVSGLAAKGYRTICIGGVGFFNKLTPLGRVLPALFEESYWEPRLGVTDPRSTEHQLRLAADLLASGDRRPVFLFINISALHQPNFFYREGATADSLDTHRAALEYVDRQLPILTGALARRGPCHAVICSDHGTAYGEDGYLGHRIAHPVVWRVPYAEAIIPAAP